MPKSRRSRRGRRTRRAAPDTAVDSRAAEALTVAWMNAVVTTALCEVGGVVAQWFVARLEPEGALRLLPAILLFAATVVGLLTLGLTVLVHRARTVPPPSSVTWFAVVIAAAPLVAIALRALLNWQ